MPLFREEIFQTEVVKRFVVHFLKIILSKNDWFHNYLKHSNIQPLYMIKKYVHSRS